MQGLVQSSDDVITIPAISGGVVASTFYLVGALLLMAVATAAAGDLVAMRRRGVFDYTAEGSASGQAWAVGDAVYWDDTNKRLTKTSSGNTLVGVAVAAKVTTATSGRFVLTK